MRRNPVQIVVEELGLSATFSSELKHAKICKSACKENKYHWIHR